MIKLSYRKYEFEHVEIDGFWFWVLPDWEDVTSYIINIGSLTRRVESENPGEAGVVVFDNLSLRMHYNGLIQQIFEQDLDISKRYMFMLEEEYESGTIKKFEGMVDFTTITQEYYRDNSGKLLLTIDFEVVDKLTALRLLHTEIDVRDNTKLLHDWNTNISVDTINIRTESADHVGFHKWFTLAYQAGSSLVANSLPDAPPVGSYIQSPFDKSFVSCITFRGKRNTHQGSLDPIVYDVITADNSYPIAGSNVEWRDNLNVWSREYYGVGFTVTESVNDYLIWYKRDGVERSYTCTGIKLIGFNAISLIEILLRQAWQDIIFINNSGHNNFILPPDLAHRLFSGHPFDLHPLEAIEYLANTMDCYFYFNTKGEFILEAKENIGEALTVHSLNFEHLISGTKNHFWDKLVDAVEINARSYLKYFPGQTTLVENTQLVTNLIFFKIYLIVVRDNHFSKDDWVLLVYPNPENANDQEKLQWGHIISGPELTDDLQGFGYLIRVTEPVGKINIFESGAAVVLVDDVDVYPRWRGEYIEGHAKVVKRDDIKPSNVLNKEIIVVDEYINTIDKLNNYAHDFAVKYLEFYGHRKESYQLTFYYHHEEAQWEIIDEFLIDGKRYFVTEFSIDYASREISFELISVDSYVYDFETVKIPKLLPEDRGVGISTATLTSGGDSGEEVITQPTLPPGSSTGRNVIYRAGELLIPEGKTVVMFDTVETDEYYLNFRLNDKHDNDESDERTAIGANILNRGHNSFLIDAVLSGWLSFFLILFRTDAIEDIPFEYQVPEYGVLLHDADYKEKYDLPENEDMSGRIIFYNSTQQKTVPTSPDAAVWHTALYAGADNLRYVGNKTFVAAMVATYDFNPSVEGIRLMKSTDDGATWNHIELPGWVNDLHRIDQTYIAAREGSLVHIFARAQETNLTPLAIYHQTYNLDTEVASSIEKISDFDDTAHYRVCCDIDLNNVVHVIWHRRYYDDIEVGSQIDRVEYVNNEGGLWSSPIVVSHPNAEHHIYAASLRVDNDNNVHILMGWLQDASPYSNARHAIYYRKREGDNWQTFTPVQPGMYNVDGSHYIEIDAIGFPKLAVGFNNRMVMVYEYYNRNGSTTTHLKGRIFDGTSWLSPITIETDGVNDVWFSWEGENVATDKYGRFVVVFTYWDQHDDKRLKVYGINQDNEFYEVEDKLLFELIDTYTSSHISVVGY